MSKLSQILVGMFFCGLIFFIVVILAVGALSRRSAGGTLASGRVIMTQSDSWYLTSSFSADTATIKTAGHTIVVAPQQLKIDGAIFAAIEPTAKSVVVNVQNDTIEFVADGRTLATYAK